MQPLRPQVQRAPFSLTTTWPISAAAPRPIQGLPWRMIPPPTPVPQQTPSSDLSLRRRRAGTRRPRPPARRCRAPPGSRAARKAPPPAGRAPPSRAGCAPPRRCPPYCRRPLASPRRSRQGRPSPRPPRRPPRAWRRRSGRSRAGGPPSCGVGSLASPRTLPRVTSPPPGPSSRPGRRRLSQLLTLNRRGHLVVGAEEVVWVVLGRGPGAAARRSRRRRRARRAPARRRS